MTAAKFILKAANALVSLVVVLALITAGAYSCYALWDNNRIYAAAGNVQEDMLRLKPTVQSGSDGDQGASFGELLSINPDVKVDAWQCFYLPERAGEFDFGAYDYVVDEVDNVTAKIDIICNSKEAGVPVISSMGTGNKLDPSMFKIADIEKTKVCPLAKVVRKELRKRGISGVKVLYSEEEPKKPAVECKDEDGESTSKRTPASISFVPSAAGLMIAGRVVLDILEI